MRTDTEAPRGNYDLPETDRAVAAIIGRSRAIALSRHICWGARGKDRDRGCLYVPKHLDPTKPSRLLALVGAELLSAEDAANLVAAFPGEVLMFTGCHSAIVRARDKLIRRYRGAGIRCVTLASAAGITDRTVRRICEGVDVPEAVDESQFPAMLATLSATAWMMRVA